jgi:hypothetical protein
MARMGPQRNESIPQKSGRIARFGQHTARSPCVPIGLAYDPVLDRLFFAAHLGSAVYVIDGTTGAARAGPVTETAALTEVATLPPEMSAGTGRVYSFVAELYQWKGSPPPSGIIPPALPLRMLRGEPASISAIAFDPPTATLFIADDVGNCVLSVRASGSQGTGRR